MQMRSINSKPIIFVDLNSRRSRRKPERREERDRPLPPLLARVGGNIEVSYEKEKMFIKFKFN